MVIPNPERVRFSEFPFTLERAEADGDGLTIEGYAAVYNSPTHVRDQDGEYDEVILPGAFARTLKASTPTLMFEHGKHPVIGTMPLGRIGEVRDDARGVWYRGRLSDNWLIAPVRDAIRDGAITGQSFAWSPVKHDWSGKTSSACRYGSLRSVRELRCREMGPVVAPAYQDTSVAVRSALRNLEPALLGSGLTIAVNSTNTATRDDELSTQAPDRRELVEDAIEAAWGIGDVNDDVYILDLYDDRAVFCVVGATASAHKGLWQVSYSYNGGAVSLGTPAQVQAVEMRSDDPPEGALVTRADDTDTSEEPADTVGTSEEPVAPNRRTAGAPRAEVIRLVSLRARGIDPNMKGLEK
jgi:HK97 family phage prohead protease